MSFLHIVMYGTLYCFICIATWAALDEAVSDDFVPPMVALWPITWAILLPYILFWRPIKALLRKRGSRPDVE